MKTLIVYASKHGSAEKCSRLLRDRLQGDVVISDIKKEGTYNLVTFDKIIIGGSIYVGKIQKEISEFCEKSLGELRGKKIGLYICCMNKAEELKQLNSVFPKELFDNALAKECFGGEFNFTKMNLLEKLAVKMVSKSMGTPITETRRDVSMLSEEKINKFAQAMNRV